MYFTCMQKICTNKSAVEKQERKLVVRHVLKKMGSEDEQLEVG